MKIPIIFIFVGLLLVSKTHSAQINDTAVFELEPDARILSITPNSQRALAFAQVYSKLSDHLQTYIGEPAVITTLAFESHVVKDVSLNLEFLEQGIQVAKALQAAERKDFSRIGFFLNESYKILKHKEAKKGIYAYGLQPFFSNPPWQWGWQHLDNTVKELEFLYENMSAMNMHIFRFMTTPGVSALGVYFKAVQEKAESFDGWVDFPDDHNQILKQAFRRLYLLKKSLNLRERQQLSYEFSILMIAFEQIYAQVYYDQIKIPHKKLAGSFSVNDPIGYYPLAKASWADFRVRFSLPLDKKIEMSQVTPEMILMNSKRSGTIPHYYYDRIMSPKALLMIEAPDKVKNFQAKYPDNFEGSQPGQSRALYLLESHGCLGCHTHILAGGSGIVGPDLSHIGSRLSHQSLFSSIVDPNLEISNRCAGGTCPADVMPKSYKERLSEQDIQILVDYLAQSR